MLASRSWAGKHRVVSAMSRIHGPVPVAFIHHKVAFERRSAKREEASLKLRWKPTRTPVASELPHAPPGKALHVESIQGARVINFNKAAVSNRLDYRTLRQLRRQLIHLEDNDRVQVIVLRGTHDDVFSAGVDLKALYELAKDPATRRQALEYFREESYLAHVIATYTKPIVTCAHGVSAGTAMSFALNSSHMYTAENTKAVFPEASVGMVPTAGASYRLAQLDNGVGMYMGLTGAALQGAELYWAGVSDFFAPNHVLREMPEMMGHLHSHAAWDHVMEEDPVYKRNLAALRHSRGSERWRFVVDNMPTGINRDSLESYAADKNWYANLGDDDVEEEPSRNGRPPRPPVTMFMTTEDKGNLFDFGAGAEVDGWDQLPEPLSRVLESKNRLGCSAAHAHSEAAGWLDDGPSEELVGLLDMVKRCFGGDATQGDPVLELDQAPVPAARTRDQWLDSVKDAQLPEDWEASLPVSLYSVVTDVYVAMQLAPHPAELPQVVCAVSAAVARGWPHGVLDDVRLDDLCHEFKIPDRKELYDIVQGAVTLVTARLHNMPPGPLVHPERLARLRQEREDALHRAKHFTEQGEELTPKLATDPANITVEDSYYHLQGTVMDATSVPSMELLSQHDMESRLPLTDLAQEFDEPPYDPTKPHPPRALEALRASNTARAEAWMAQHGVSMKDARRLLEDLDLDGIIPLERHRMPKALAEADEFLEQFGDAIALGAEGEAAEASTPNIAAVLDSLPAATGGSPSGVTTTDNSDPFAEFRAAQGAGPSLVDFADSDDEEEQDSLKDAKRRTAELATRLAHGQGESPSEQYLEEVTSDPVKLVAAYGMPRNEFTLDTAAEVVQAFKDERAAKHAPPMPRSVSEIVSRLRSDDTPQASDALRAMERRDPLALKAIHRMIVEASTKPSVEDCLSTEFRVTANLLEREDTLIALERASTASGNAPWSGRSIDDVTDAEVDALFTALHPARELTLPLRSSRLVSEAREEELEEWKDKLSAVVESGESQGVLGAMMKKRVVWW